MESLVTIHPEYLSLNQDQIHALMPYIVVFLGTVTAILVSVLRGINLKWLVFLITLATCAAGAMSSFQLLNSSPLVLFNGMMVADGFSNFFNLIFLSSAALTALVSLRYLDHEKLQYPEYYILILFSALGMMLMSSSLDLIVLFVSLELMSLAVYALVGFRRADRRSNEAAMKYFILGSAASAVFLYGVALLYGSTGCTQIRDIFDFVTKHSDALHPVFFLGSVLVLCGFFFKIAAAPFHMWMPDVYEGAPVPVTGFMTSGLKAAAFAAFLRIFVEMGYGKGLGHQLEANIHHIIWVCAVLTMTVGNFVALTQTNLKRMLAFSSIAHSGYLLMGFISGSQSEFGFLSIVFYIVIYAIMNIGAFVVLTILASRDDSDLNLHDFSGLSKRHPWIAFALAVFLLSMAGIPLTAGFVSKYLLFYSAIQANEIALVVIGVLCSAVSVYYYLRVLVYMYMYDAAGSPRALRVSVWAAAALAVMLILTLQVGVFPSWMIDFARKAVTSL